MDVQKLSVLEKIALALSLLGWGLYRVGKRGESSEGWEWTGPYGDYFRIYGSWSIPPHLPSVALKMIEAAIERKDYWLGGKRKWGVLSGCRECDDCYQPNQSKADMRCWALGIRLEPDPDWHSFPKCCPLRNVKENDAVAGNKTVTITREMVEEIKQFAEEL